jgi:hypothetical protein
MRCHRCGKDIQINGKVSRTAACPGCDTDMHVCLNCTFYDPYAPNQCRETQVELVQHKEKTNFCEYFTPNEKMAMDSNPASKQEDARKLFDNLFKK